MRHVIFGCSGPVGVELMRLLAEEGHDVVGVCRSGRSEAPAGATIVAGDAADAARAAEISAGAHVVHSAIGIDYRVWLEQWMPIVEGLLHAAESAGARLVFADNLYCYGPQTEPLREDMPLTGYGRKPALRARMVERMMAAHEAGRTQVAFVRAADFFGPRVRNAFLGERVFAPALAGKAAQLIGDPDREHAYAYAPDFARAIVAVASADDAFGQAWHAPHPPVRTTRDIVREIFSLAGREPRMSVLPEPALAVLGWFLPLLGELREMRFQRDRPYRVDSSRFEARFGLAATPWTEALQATLAWYRDAAIRGRIRGGTDSGGSS